MRSTRNDPFLTHTGGKAPAPQAPWSPPRVAWLACLLYFANLTIFSFLLQPEGVIDTRWAVVIATLVMSVYFGYPAPSPFRRKVYDWTPLMCYLGACVLGLYFGHTNYDSSLKPYYTLLMNREYTTVVASEPAGAHLDAGIIYFVPGSRLDVTQGTAYTDAHSRFTLCAAPVIDDTTTSMSFWAVGIGCCSSEQFWCDDAADPSVRSAARWTPPFMTRHIDLDFRPVAAKAAAMHGFTLGDEQLFLQWVKDPTALKYGMLRDGIVGYFLFLCIALVLFFIAFKIKPPKYASIVDPARSMIRDPFGSDVFYRRSSRTSFA
eukprot:GEMP01060681.1.p1 GENE.GEMP01060681.1~~GEMP01060681.1.p1  ORF type:complete len:319 (+),score=61.27 GEMP01060681.1:159-1115(+)